ncbi:hypothetical protein TPA0906_74450 [Streptomyces olivaceus]|nr:hypothetical protein TPA0906_74450 [Streptomyces olivaceus]
MATAKAARVAVEWLPSRAVSSSAPAEAVIMVKYSGSAVVAIAAHVLRLAGPVLRLITASIITLRQLTGQQKR